MCTKWSNGVVQSHDGDELCCIGGLCGLRAFLNLLYVDSAVARYCLSVSAIVKHREYLLIASCMMYPYIVRTTRPIDPHGPTSPIPPPLSASPKASHRIRTINTLT